MEKYEIQKLRDLPIEEVAERLGLQVVRHKSLCPFHDDHHASLSFSVGRNMCRCFVCMEKSLGTIDLVMRSLHVDFVAACRWLADKFGVALSSSRRAAVPSCDYGSQGWSLGRSSAGAGKPFSGIENSDGFGKPAILKSQTASDNAARNEASGKSSAPHGFDANRYVRFFEHPWLSDEARRFLFDERHLDERVVRWCRLTSWCDREGTHWLQIPYFDLGGRLIGIQNRNLDYPKSSSTVSETLADFADSADSRKYTESTDSRKNADSTASRKNADSTDSRKNADTADSKKNATSDDSQKNADSDDSQKNATSTDSQKNATPNDSQKNATSNDSRKNADSVDSRKNADSTASRKNADSTDSRKNADTADSRKNADSTDSRKNADTADSRKNAESVDSKKNVTSDDSLKNATSTDSQKNATSNDSRKNTTSNELQKETAKPRFRFPYGAKCGIYNLPVIARMKPGDELYITEGCSDCWAMLSAGHKAIAIPSATLLTPEDRTLLVQLSQRLAIKWHMFPDKDVPGERLFLQLKELLPSLEHHQLPLGCKDFGEWFRRGLVALPCPPS